MLNINIGLLGHVDSGKTTLAKRLSEVSSTASFDKHPQAQERGITIDLGFSSFKTNAPSHLQKFETVQFTLVDCPGHASLISTVIGGAQIIDMMILVVDASKGVQTQTAECMVIAEITNKKLIVVINKTDLLKNQGQQEKIIRKMRATVDNMAFKGCAIVCASAGQGDVQEVIECLKAQAFVPDRDASTPFLMAVDHCFGIQGKGTVLTGTILQGTIQLNDEIEIPAIKAIKKVKSIQMFRQAVEKASQGDRVGVCVTQFEPKLLERGLVSKHNLLTPIHAAILDFHRVRFHTNAISSRSRYHVSIGHETVLASTLLFETDSSDKSPFDLKREYKFVPTLDESVGSKQLFALVEFDRPVLAASLAWAIGARLDADKHTASCRMAFYGQLQHSFYSKNYKQDSLPQLKVYKEKCREGTVERVSDEQTVIGRNMFKKMTDMSKFIGMAVSLTTGENGVIESAFGQSGKFKVRVQEGLKSTTIDVLKTEVKGKPVPGDKKEITIFLRHKKFIFDPQKRMIQGHHK